jgi:hypothetical protein
VVLSKSELGVLLLTRFNELVAELTSGGTAKLEQAATALSA